MKMEMGKDGDQGERSKSQRTTMVSSPSDEASLPRSLCREMCMICKKKDLKLKHSRQLQSKIVTKTGEKTLKGAAFGRNDKDAIIIVLKAYLTANQFQKHKKCYFDYTRIVIKSSSAAESTSEETCFGNRDYDSVQSLINNDVFASHQCLSMETIVMEYSGSIETKQSRIKLTERLLNSYSDKLVFLQTD